MKPQRIDPARVERNAIVTDHWEIVDGFTGLTERSDGRVEFSRLSRCFRTCAPRPGPFRVADPSTPDESLARLITLWRRAVEDGGVVDESCQPAARTYADLIAEARQAQLSRFALRMRYGARHPHGPEGDRGTDIYDHYMRLDQPPSYWLAASLDRARADAGQSSVLAWPACEAAA